MRFLPKWALVNPFPAVYDFESLTATEQTARVYGAMNEMIREYNAFVDQINNEIESFVGSSNAEISSFTENIEKRIRCKFEEMEAAFAKMKVDLTHYADAKIPEACDQYLGDYVDQVINQKIANGDIKITLVYDPETESLEIATGGE